MIRKYEMQNSISILKLKVKHVFKWSMQNFKTLVWWLRWVNCHTNERMARKAITEQISILLDRKSATLRMAVHKHLNTAKAQHLQTNLHIVLYTLMFLVHYHWIQWSEVKFWKFRAKVQPSGAGELLWGFLCQIPHPGASGVSSIESLWTCRKCKSVGV